MFTQALCVLLTVVLLILRCAIMYIILPGLQVEPGSCLQRLCGSVQTGLILKDISLEVRAGEVLAVLGSKGNIHTLCWSPLKHYLKWQTWKWQFWPVQCLWRNKEKLYVRLRVFTRRVQYQHLGMLNPKTSDSLCFSYEFKLEKRAERHCWSAGILCRKWEESSAGGGVPPQPGSNSRSDSSGWSPYDTEFVPA